MTAKLENTWSKKRPFKKALIAKRKSFWVTRLVSFKGKVEKQNRKFRFDDWVKYWGLDKSDSSKVVAFSPNYIGAEPTRPISCNTILYRELASLYQKMEKGQLRDSLEASLGTYREVWSGSYESNAPHLKKYFAPNQSKQSLEDLLELVFLAGEWFRIGDCDFTDSSEILWMYNMSPDTYNGHYTSRFLHADRKRNTYKISSQIAIQSIDYIKEKPMMNYCIWDMFARAKDIKVPNVDGVELTTRNIMTTEEYVQMIIGWVFQKISWQTEKGRNPNNCFHIKGEYNSTKAKALFEKRKNFDFVLDADWSFFDSTIDTQYLEAAALIALSPSVKDKKSLRLMHYVMSSIITKFIILPPGVVIELNRGQASGHPGGTMVNCLVNILRWCVIGKAIYGNDFSKFMDLEVYGDDAIIYFKNHPNLWKIDEIITENGYLSDPLVDRLYPVALMDSEPQSGPDFLKRVYSDEGMAWNRTKLFNKLLYPSRNRSNEEHLLTVLNFINTAPADVEMNNLLRELITNCINKIGRDGIDPITLGQCDQFINAGIDKRIIERFTNVSRDATHIGLLKQTNICKQSIEVYIPRLLSTYNVKMKYRTSSIARLIAVSYPPSWINDNLKFLPELSIKPKFVDPSGYIEYSFIGRVSRGLSLSRSKPSC